MKATYKTDHMTFIDELTIYMKAGDGGDGVVRWRREKFRPKGGPAGGDGGRGGDIRVRAVRDAGLLARYRHKDEFRAEDGEDGRKNSQDGKAGEELVIDLPVGSVITNRKTGKEIELLEEGQEELLLRGGEGGLGNEHFKSSTNQRPTECTSGEPGEEAQIHIELRLIADAGFIGLPNAGKSTLLNTLTNAHAKTASYAFTTLSPNLGAFHGYILADIPGLIEGASEGKGLGFTFLRHIQRTKILIHCVSLENDDTVSAYESVRTELSEYEEALADKREIVLLTKSDVLDPEDAQKAKKRMEEHVGKPVFLISILDNESVETFTTALSQTLQKAEKGD